MAGTIPSFSEIGLNTGSAYQEAGRRFHAPWRRAPGPHGRDRSPRDPDGDQQRGAGRQGAPRLRRAGHHDHPARSRWPGARYTPEGEDLIAWDLEGAKQLLEDAGYTDTDGDGVREMPPGSLDPGRPLQFRYYVRTSEQTSVDAAPFVSEWLAEIGIETEVLAVTSGRLGDIINEGTYDMFSWGWIPRPGPGLGPVLVHLRPAAAGRQRLREQRLVLLQPRVRPAVPRAARRARPGGALGDRARDAEDLLRGRRRTRSCGTTRSCPRGAPTAGRASSSSRSRSVTRSRAGADPARSGGRSTRSGTGGGGQDTKGIPPAIWAVVAGALVILGAIFIGRRRKVGDEDV